MLSIRAYKLLSSVMLEYN